MKCPECSAPDTRVMETRMTEDGRVIRRRRACPACGFRFTTYERVEEPPILWIQKKDGRREAFDRTKLIRGITRSCERLPVSLETIEDMAAKIERKLRESGEEGSSTAIGEMVMDELAEVNKVAYVRFASVYREFTDLSSFEKEISSLLERAKKNAEASPETPMVDNMGDNMCDKKIEQDNKYGKRIKKESKK